MPLPATALIVDDEQHARTYVQLLLKELGVTTFWEAGDGGEAMELFDAHRPELVLLDVNLRVMTGLQVLQHMKLNRPDVPVVMLSSESAMGTVQEALQLGATAYLLKHTPKADALRLLREVFDNPAEEGPESEG